VPKRLKRQLQAQRYAEAESQGRGDVWLKAHPRARARLAKNPQRRIRRGANILGGDAGKFARAEGVISRGQAGTAIEMQNPSAYSDPFSTQTVTLDAQGRPIVTKKLSEPQQQILNQGQTLTQSGLGKAQDLVGGYEKFGMTPESLAQMRDKITENAYAQLTRNVDRDYGMEKEQIEQDMYNRGIPLDPTNPLYKRHMDALNEKYAGVKERARQDAIGMGGQEMERQYGMGLKSHQQNLSDAGTLQGMGTGLQLGNAPQFQAPQMMQSAAGDLALGVRAQDTSREVANINANAMLKAAAMKGKEPAQPPLRGQ